MPFLNRQLRTSKYLTDYVLFFVLQAVSRTFAGSFQSKPLWVLHTVWCAGRTHPQAVDTFKRISALLGLPLALAPALSARGIGGVGGCVWAFCVGATLNADGIVLQPAATQTNVLFNAKSSSKHAH